MPAEVGDGRLLADPQDGWVKLNIDKAKDHWGEKEVVLLNVLMTRHKKHSAGVGLLLF